ncbi:GroES-like protein [Rhizodiscina lignyota]|uniref:GroES-like protein n=1 Tax=Rhizodiscina lignyota TaxID=1504668 RepID=A0A9P4IQ80_9PEZI|nr:GroES-like protein [Rhizodiscina lignyota]
MAETMRAVDIKNGAGPIEALFINEIPKPKPTATQALVKIKYFGLNRMDLSQREGGYPVPPQAPKTLGVEFSGVIEAFGNEPERGFNIGDEVFGLAYGGAYAEYIAVSTHMLVHKPKELSWEECAGIPETWITATQALYLIGEYTPGKTVLWHAGASSVSISGIQLSVGDGASKVFATTRQDSKCEFVVKELGATAAFNATTTKWDEEILKATDGKGVDIIIDFVGAGYFAQNLNAAARDGRIVNLGILGPAIVPAGANFSNFVRKRLRLEGSSLRSRDENYQGRLRDMLVEHALPKFVSGQFKIHIEKVFPWEEIQDAHRIMAENKTMGKLICRVS